MSKAFRDVPQASFPDMEESILQFWQDSSAFGKSLEARKDGPRFVFYDGPPFATGLPHYGHMVVGAIKDIVGRYWTMRGHYVERRFGWDCHGLPIEMEVEKTLHLSGRSDIEDFGIPAFNETCRSIVMKCAKDWEKIMNRFGRWVDFKADYKTMDRWYMESIWWVFKQLWEKGLIYQGHKVMPYSWRCGTPLSNFEANMNYQEVQDPAITVRFKMEEKNNAYFLAWTTTPWTLPGNLALCVGPEIEYVIVEDDGAQYVLAEARLDAYYKDASRVNVVERCRGRDLDGVRYEPLFPYFEDQRPQGAFRVILGDFVSTDDGTGIVHIAPAYGEDDWAVCRRSGIALVDGVDAEGNFKAIVTDFAGRNVKDADKDIIRYLKARNCVVHQGTIRHSYPYCWRTETPLIYKAISTWFVNVTDIKEKMIANNEKIHWIPDYVGEKRFANWLEDARDWAISRNRFWGTPIPVWQCDACGHVQVMGSIAELEACCRKKLDDIHKHFVDPLTWRCAACDEGKMQRVPEVLDCWFESGAMPYAQSHYPFENQELFERNFPADFIAEALDQTRGWFYTLLVIASALFDKPAFQNVIVNGMILAEDGSKMSKRKKNYPDPRKIMERYGADALRTYMINSPVMRAEPLRFSESGVAEVVRAILLPLWNAYSFFVTYANTDAWHPRRHEKIPSRMRPDMDRWILSRLQTMLDRVNHEMESYRLYNVVAPLLHFINDLTNWYIRLSRRRFWKSRNDADKEAAYDTLHDVLVTFVKALAPFMPYVTEEIYQNLSGDHEPLRGLSVHHASYPTADLALQDPGLEREIGIVRTAVNLGRSLRTRNKVKIRQPLPHMTVVSRNERVGSACRKFEALMKDELNVKEILVSDHEDALVTYRARPNLPRLGKRCGKKLKTLTAKIQALSSPQLQGVLAGEAIELCNETLTRHDLLIDRQEKAGTAVANEGDVTVALALELTPDLIADGNAREFVNRVQNMRKKAGLHVADRIAVHVVCDENLWDDLDTHRAYIMAEILAVALDADNGPSDFVSECDINGATARVAIAKIVEQPGPV